MATKIDYDAQLSAMKSTGVVSAPKEKLTKEELAAKNAEILKKYFLPNLGNNESKKTLTFRMLPENNPIVNGPSPIKVVHHHAVEYGGNKYKFVCLKEFGQECPLCETHKALMDQGEKEAAKKWRSRPFYIIKGIDRAKPEDGVKFWRINHHYKGAGDHDMIQAIIDSKGNISHPEKGRDLNITLKKGDDGNQVRTIMNDDISKLSDDPKIMEILLNDTTTWKDIFLPKEAKYLEDIVFGKASYWDKVQNKYINPTQEEKSNGEESGNPLMKGEIEDDPTDEKVSDTKSTGKKDVEPSLDDSDMPF